MDTTIRATLLFLAFVALTWGVHQTAHIIAPFALAVFIWLIIDAFARWLDGLSPKMPYWFALTIAVLTVVASMIGIVFIIADTAQEVSQEAPKYQARLSEIFSWLSHNPIFERFLGENVTFGELSQKLELNQKLQGLMAGFASTIQGVASNLSLIHI